jgi:hypothetical protein
VLKTMLVKKRKMARMVLLVLCMVGAGTTMHRAAADPPPMSHVIDDMSRLPPEAARWHTYVSQPLWPGELAYRQIPWLVDLNEGLRVARDEKRPLLLWTSGDDPLDRC